MSERPIIQWKASGESANWIPVTMDLLEKHEVFLEDALVASPELLLLESRRTGIRGPFAIFRQISMRTPSGRSIFPDIVILAASGHVIVVEVKRYINPELKDRAVIAQIIDYASSFASLSEAQCAKFFGNDESSTWTDCVDKLFPDDPDADELAAVLFERMQGGELNLVIACDKIPAGLPEVVAGICSQSVLAFDLDLVEVVPYVRDVSASAEILLVPSLRVSTDIVSRTAVSVTYREGDAQPSTTVQATSLDEIEAGLKSAQSNTRADARNWAVVDVEEAISAGAHPVIPKLFEFSKLHSADGQVIAPGKKQNASFGFYVTGTCEGKPVRRMIFNCVADWSVVYLYLNFADAMSSDQVTDELWERLRILFGNNIDRSRKEISLSCDQVEPHFEDFCETILWFKDAVEQDAPSDSIS